MTEAWAGKDMQLHSMHLLQLCAEIFVQTPLQKGKLRAVQKLKIFRLFAKIIDLSVPDQSECPQGVADTMRRLKGMWTLGILVGLLTFTCVT